MNYIDKIAVIIWSCLAIICFVSSFWAPLFFKITGITFGIMNVIIILVNVYEYLIKKFNNNNIEDDLKDGM